MLERRHHVRLGNLLKMLERRQHVRLRNPLKIIYKNAEQIYGQASCSSEDISSGGIRFLTKHRLETGTILDLELYLPRSVDPIILNGEVVWCRDISDAQFLCMVGVKIVNINPADRGKILSYIRKGIVGNKDTGDFLARPKESSPF